MPKVTMTQGDFASRLRVSRKTVCNWRSRGLVVLANDGFVDVAASEARLRKRPEVYRGGRSRSLFTPRPRWPGVPLTCPVLDDPFE
jgi:hypothetical protein